jgi:hypothetical protein
MGNATASIPANLLSSDATFRAWAKGVSDLVKAAGLVQTADTGQINFATATWPTVASTSAGFETFYLNDSKHATDPMYIKLSYGGGTATSRAQVWIQVGTGTDGAGGLTGGAAISPLIGTNPNSSNPAGNQTAFASAVDGYFGFFQGVGSTNGGFNNLGAFRYRDYTDGTLSTRRGVFAGSALTGLTHAAYNPETVAWSATSSNFSVLFPDITTTPHGVATGGQIGFVPGLLYQQGKFYQTPFFLGKNADVNTTAALTMVTPWGTKDFFTLPGFGFGTTTVGVIPWS